MLLPKQYRFSNSRWCWRIWLLDCLGMVIFLPWTILECFPRRPSIKSILVIQLDHLGDAVLSIPLLLSLKSQFLDANIDVLASESNAEVFRELSCVHQVHTSECNRFSRFGKQSGWIPSIFWWGWRLRNQYQLGIDVRGELPHALLLWLAGIPVRVGWAAGGGGYLLTHRPEYIVGRHEVASRDAMLIELGVSTDRPIRSVHQLFPSISSQETQSDTQPRVVLHLGAGTPAKHWPIEYWQQLAKQILANHHVQIGLVGAEHEMPLAERLLATLPQDRIENRVGKLSLVDLIGYLASSQGYIGADSGPAHLAALCDIPTTVLFSGINQVEQWQPYGSQVQVLSHPVSCSPCNQNECPFSDHPCMRLLLPAKVYQACRNWLNAVSPEAHHDISVARV